MKVVVIAGAFPPMTSGAANYAFHLCEGLAQAGLAIDVITSCRGNGVPDKSMRIYPMMRHWSWAEMPRLVQGVRRGRPDVVNIHFNGMIYNDHPMVTFVPSALKRLIRDVRIVTAIEFPVGAEVATSDWQTRAVRKLMARVVGRRGVDYGYGTILRDSDRIIVLSEAHTPILARRLDGVERKCVLIPPPPLMRICGEGNGTARREERERLRVCLDEVVIAYYGYVYPGKGIETLLEAVRVLEQRGRRVRLVVVGGSSEFASKVTGRPNYPGEMGELAEGLGISDRVVWTGYCRSDSEEASRYLRGADIGVLPFDEGVRLHRSSVAAVAAHGLPIITTRGQTLESAFVDGKNVLLCVPRDPKALADCIESVMVNAEVRCQLATGALELARTWFSWEKAIERTIQTFRR